MLLLLLGVSLVSAAGLAFEITLTRLFAIAQGYHFGFLAVSLALLGFGASGTALALRPQLARGELVPRLARLALLFSASLVASYLVINYLPFDAYRVAWEPVQLLYLVLYYLALVAPFFLGGLVVGVPLAAREPPSANVYAANLVGSGVGCLAALGALAGVGGTGAVILAALLAALGALAFSAGARASQRLLSFALVLVLGALVILRPSFLELQISPYKSLSQTLRFPDARIAWNAWNAFSQVEVVESSAVRSAPGLSLTYGGSIPPQRALFVDAEGRAPWTDSAPPALLDALPVTLAYRLRPNARVLMLPPGGGLEMLAALRGGAREVVAVEENPLVAAAAHQFAPSVFGNPRVRLITASARGHIARSRERYDVVHLALGDSFRPVTAGAYSLGENYVYTEEAFRSYLEHLNDDGILVASRWLQLPPSEEVRLGALAVAALDGAPGEHMLALRSFSTLLLLAKRTPFTARELEIADTFAAERQFDWVARPGLSPDQTNRFNILKEDEYYSSFRQLFDRERRAQFLAGYPYDVTPPTDDRPFIFNYWKWEQTPQVIQLLGKLWQPFGGSGYLILLALLVLSIVASAGLILLPLVKLRRQAWSREKNGVGIERESATGRDASGARANRRMLGELVYFSSLGIGFLFVEIPLIQRFILVLDHPVYAFATVLFALLMASGVGSALSPRLPQRTALALLVVAILSYPLVLPLVLPLFLGEPFALRVLVSLLLLAPMGLLMGMPFPQGLARLSRSMPGLIPLAWGINGCASVISSILATIGAMAWGFSAVMLAGAGAYALALTTVWKDKDPKGSAKPLGSG